VVEKQIEALIESGWRAIAGNLEDCALQQWRKSALECLSLVVGPDHTYTEHFATEQVQPEPTNVLADVGVLTAASLWLSQGCNHDTKKWPRT